MKLHDFLFLKQWPLRYLVYLFGSISLALGVYVVTTLIMKPHGEQGYSLLQASFFVLLGAVLASVLLEIGFLDQMSEALRKKLHLGYVLIGLIGMSFTFGVIGFYKLKQNYPTNFLDKPNRQTHQNIDVPKIEKLSKQALDTQWREQKWLGYAPACIEFVDQGINNNCPTKVKLNYCWTMPDDQQWGIKHTDCFKNEYQWLNVNVGFTPYPSQHQTRPWCRSYHAECLAKAKVLCAVAQTYKGAVEQACKRH